MGQSGLLGRLSTATLPRIYTSNDGPRSIVSGDSKGKHGIPILRLDSLTFRPMPRCLWNDACGMMLVYWSMTMYSPLVLRLHKTIHFLRHTRSRQFCPQMPAIRLSDLSRSRSSGWGIQRKHGTPDSRTPQNCHHLPKMEPCRFRSGCDVSLKNISHSIRLSRCQGSRCPLHRRIPSHLKTSSCVMR